MDDMLGEEHPARTTPFPVKPSSRGCSSRNDSLSLQELAKEDAHPRRSGEADEIGHPLSSLDVEMFEEKIIVLVAKDESTGATLAYDCFAKGCRDVRLQTDGEPAMLDMQQAIAEARMGDAAHRNSPA